MNLSAVKWRRILSPSASHLVGRKHQVGELYCARFTWCKWPATEPKSIEIAINDIFSGLWCFPTQLSWGRVLRSGGWDHKVVCKSDVRDFLLLSGDAHNAIISPCIVSDRLRAVLPYMHVWINIWISTGVTGSSIEGWPPRHYSCHFLAFHISWSLLIQAADCLLR